MKTLKGYSLLIGIFLTHLLWITYIQNVLYPIHFVPQNLFILNLVGKEVGIPNIVLLLFGTGNIIIIWLISRKIFANNFSLIPSLIYAISPWGSYLVAAGSFYIYLSFLILLLSYGLLLIKLNQKYLGTFLTLGASAIALYSSIFLLVLVPLIFILMITGGVMPFNKIKKASILLIILMTPLLFFIYNNYTNFNSIFRSEITIFSDPGLLNMVNSYQGAAKQEHLGGLARISENKYIFFTEYIFLKYIKQFTPSTYFTPQEKLLGFSFSPPLYLGFLIPFAFGFYQLLRSSGLRGLLLLPILLVTPSVLSKAMVDLNRLFIIMPVIIMVTTFGLNLLFEQRKKKKIAIFLAITIFLVIFQLIIAVSDIQLREKERFIKYFGQNYEIGKQ